MPCPCCNAVVCERNCPGSADAIPAIPADSQKGLVWLEFSSCIGSGAAGTVDAPVAVSPCDYKGLAGPITGVTLTNKGSGYARLGRVEPTVSASAEGTGAVFTVTLEQDTEPLGEGCPPIPYWKVAAVAVSSIGASGYEDGGGITFTVADGDTEEVAAVATLVFDRIEPFVSMDGTATATVTLEGTAALPDAEWSVSAVSVTSGGSGYANGDPVAFSTSDTQISPAAGTALVLYAEPVNAELTVSSENGSGAVLTPVWELLPEETWLAQNVRLYRLAGVTVADGGSDYADNDVISIVFTSVENGQELGAAQIDCGIVGVGGVIEEVVISDSGAYVGSITDELESVVITDGGRYYRATPDDMSVTVTNPGKYYREDPDEPPVVADVTVTVQQEAPSDGVDAEIEATVESDTSSEDFGKIAELNVVNGGSGYLKPDLACEVGDTLYLQWGDYSTSITLREPQEWMGVAPSPYSSPLNPSATICGDWTCDEEDVVPGNISANKEIHGLFLWRYPSVNQMVFPDEPARCLCNYVTISFDLLWACGRCGDFGYGIYGQIYQYQEIAVCARFLADENGCPTGDAVVTQWAIPGGTPIDVDNPNGGVPEWDTEFVCNKACFQEGPMPQISFMP